MRKILLLAFLTSFSFITANNIYGQSCVPTNLNGTNVIFPCNATCQNIKFSVPDLRSDESYVLSSIPYNFYPATSGTEVTSTYIDDQYSSLVPLTFPFCFYDSTYNNIVIGSNGIVTFEALCADKKNNYVLDPPISIPNGTVAAPTGIADRYIPRTAIMAGYMDIDPGIATGTPIRRIEYNVFGVAPCRKFVVSFYNVIFFGSNCGNNKMTSQIVLHEGTGLIDVFITEKPICTTWNEGNAILGIQDYSRTQGVVAPGKNCTQWSETNTGYRFTPSGATSRFISSEITNLAGTVLATGSSTTGATGLLDIDFSNFCPPSFGQYILKTTYDACPTGTSIIGLDTINLIQSPQLLFSETTTSAACGLNNGTITITVPPGSGTPPYSYILDGGPPQNSNIFTNVSGGSHTVTVTDAFGCTNTITVVVDIISSLAATSSSTGTSCAGVNNGTMTITPTSGTGPYTFVANPGGITSTTGLFTNLASGSYSVTFTDINSCNGTVNINVANGVSITASQSLTATSCSGANDGSVTITPTSGTAPYAFSLDGGSSQATGTFTGLSAGTHSVLVKDANGCTVGKDFVINPGGSLTGAITSTPASCPGVNDGTITLMAPFGATPGTAPYTYSLDGQPYQAGNTFTGVTPGLHTVTFTDANGCQGTRSINVTGGVTPNTSATAAGTSCAGGSTGVIVIVPIAGSTYTINAGSGNITNTTGTFLNLPAGTYTMSIATSGGCAGTVTPSSIVVTDGPAMSTSASTSPASCPGATNGSLTVAPVGAGTTYTLNPGAISNTTGIFNGLTAGTYTVTFVTTAGCTGTVSPNPVVTASSAVTTTAAATATCTGGNSGTITVAPLAPGTSYTLNPGAITNTTGVFNNLTAGTYTITFATPAGCTGTVSPNPVVTSTAALTTTYTAAAASCPGINDGSITVATIGAGTTYTLNPGAISNTTGVFTGLATGTYTITFVTSTGCTGTVSPDPVVTASASPTSTASTAAATCPGVSDGTVTVAPVGAGTTYTLNPGAISNTTGVFTGLGAGTYTVTFVTSAGCTGTVPANPVVTAGAAPTGTASATATSCPSLNDGTVTVTPVGAGTTYTLNPGAVSNTTGVFTGLATGTYTVTFVTAAGCNGTVPVNPVVTSGSAPVTTATTTATSCPGVADGTLTVATVGAGTIYTLNPGAVSNTTGIFTGLAAGTYTITFVTSAGCNGTVPVNPVVTSGSAPVTTATTTATSCPGVADGTLTVATVGAGTTYTLNPGAISNTTGLFTGLAAGSYTITFVTSAGCNGTVPVNPVVTSGSAPVTTATTTATSCPGVADGTLTVATVGAGTTYTLNPGAISNTTGLFTGLAAGTYTITFVTSAGCNGTVPVNPVVAAGPAITGTASATNTSCPTVNDGTITVSAPSGAGTSYTLNPGAVTNTTGIFTGLAPNTYTISFVTGAGCTGTITTNTTVGTGPALTSSFTQTNPNCANINDGVISITPQAGTTAPYSATLTGPGGPYVYNGAAPIVFSGLAPGTYNYSYAEAGGCTGTGGPITLVTNAPIYVPATLTNLSCNNSANGSVSFSPVGGVAPYQYSINGGGTYQAANSFTGLAAGPHSFRIRDNVGCTKDTTVTLTQPTVLNASTTGTTPAGCSNNDGSISATATGGTSPYSYTIAGATVNTSGSSTGVFSNLANGPYTITVTDAKGCTSTTSGTVGLTDNMFLSLGPDVTICAESSITFDPQTNSETNMFTWTAINGTAANTIANPSVKNAIATPLDTATYVLHAQWGGCERWDTIKVNVLRKPVANAGLDTAICNLTYATLRGSAGNLSGAVNYTWSPAADVEFPAQAVTRVYPPGNNMVYTYTLTVRDEYGCNFSVTDQVDVTVQPPVPAFAGNDTTAVSGTPHQLFASGGDDYLWTPSAPLNSATVQNPLATLTQDQKFVVRVTDFAGCVGYDTVFVKVYNGPAYYIPNAFTPNGDGLNDVFRPVPAGIARTEYFRIFNRFGETIFETNQYLKGWDGTYKGKKQPIGAYVWIIKGVDRDGKKIEMKGTVMLVQ